MDRSAFPFLEALPLQFGDFLDQLLHRVIIVDGLVDASLPILGKAQLAELALVALDEIEGVMQLAVGAVAGGFAALTGASGERAAQEPVARSELGDTGA